MDRCPKRGGIRLARGSGLAGSVAVAVAGVKQLAQAVTDAVTDVAEFDDVRLDFVQFRLCGRAHAGNVAALRSGGSGSPARS